MNATANTTNLTDGMRLTVEALKKNGIDTIFGVVGIPVTDLARYAQKEGIRYIGFRHEQSAGNAAAASGFITAAGNSAYRFRSRFPQRPGRAGQRYRQRLSHDSDQRFQ